MSLLIESNLVSYLFYLAVLLIVSGSLAPAHWLPPLPNDKYLHFFAYAGLSTFALLIAKTYQDFLIWLAALLIAGIIIEGIQQFIPGRQFCWRDIMANTAGICLVGIASLFCYL